MKSETENPTPAVPPNQVNRFTLRSRWKILVALFLSLASFALIHLGHLLLQSDFPITAVVPWVLSLSVTLLALVFAQEDGARLHAQEISDGEIARHPETLHPAITEWVNIWIREVGQKESAQRQVVTTRTRLEAEIRKAALLEAEVLALRLCVPALRPAPKFPIGTEVLDWRSPFHSAVRKVTKHEFREGKWWYSRLENGACIFPEDDLRPARPSVIQSIEEAVDRVESRQEKQ